MNSKTYSVSKRKSILLFSIGFGLSFILFLGNWLMTLIGLGVIVSVSYIGLVAKFTKLTLSETEISLEFSEKVKICSWNQINKIEDFKLWLRVLDQNEETAMTIPILLENYAEIKELIKMKRPDLLH